MVIARAVIVAGVSALLGGIGGLIAAVVIFALPVAAFFEARGSLFVLQYATSAYAARSLSAEMVAVVRRTRRCHRVTVCGGDAGLT